MKSKKFLVFYSLILVVIACSDADCRPCDPTDPLGHNPNNLCPRFPHSSINNNSFIEGHGRPITTIPTIQNPAGIVIQRPSGYWTNIRTTQEIRSITDSAGNTYNLPNNNSVGRR